MTDAARERRELAETLSSLGGETVDDVEIVHAEGSAVVRIGGLAISVPVLAGFVDVETDRHTMIPPTWPTLAKRTEIHDADSALPKLAWAVLRQTELVTDDDARAALDAARWAPTGTTDEQTVHVSTVTDGEATCRTELRVVPNANRRPTLHSVVYFSGPGLASSAMLTLGGDGDEPRRFIGDIVAAACGTRPPGL